MVVPGDAISVSLEELRARINALAGKRTEFPPLSEIPLTNGPAGGSSRDFRASLDRAARQLKLTVAQIAAELAEVESQIAAAGRELAAADDTVADDVNALNWMLGSAEDSIDPSVPGSTPTTTPPTAADASAGLG